MSDKPAEDKKVAGVEYDEMQSVEEVIQGGERVVLKPEDDQFSAHWIRASKCIGIDDVGTWDERRRGGEKVNVIFSKDLENIIKLVAERGYKVHHWLRNDAYNPEPYDYGPMSSVGQGTMIIFTDIPFTQRDEFVALFTKNTWRIEG